MEELLDRGARADAHDPYIRRQLAVTLAHQVGLSQRFVSLDGLRASLLASPTPHALWPEPHEVRFDFVASAGAEWIDELAWSARERLADPTDGWRLQSSSNNPKSASFTAVRPSEGVTVSVYPRGAGSGISINVHPQ